MAGSPNHPPRVPAPRVGITAAAHVLPPTLLSTADLQARVEAASGFALPAGLLERITGIRERHVVVEGEQWASSLAIEAGRAALAMAGREPEEVDLLLFASATRDFVEPATAHVVNHALGAGAHCLDVTNACNSFLNGLDLARAMIETGRASTALVVTGETPSLSTRWAVDDVRHAAQHVAGYTFGDAGAAVVLEPVETGGFGRTETETHSEHWEVGGIFGGGSRYPRDYDKLYFTGAGRELKRVFEKIGPAILDSTLAHAGLEIDDLAAVLVHQVTTPYVDRFCEVTGVPRRLLDVTVETHGNVASATLPLQLSRQWDRLQPGDTTLLLGLGGGVSVMSTLWTKS
ncbi:3-oxoacyl-ACP synthase III family protein [Nocardioides plantarum]|uniref:3-oxoacyl-ACP synthase III family protein n=1 Tax=Nocardioides plantarum TaxID=29299 RepID=A0ABV5K4I9_9ACTN|nr:ketoacyl-ACP synthase III [Nocardioides plantarum]